MSYVWIAFFEIYMRHMRHNSSEITHLDRVQSIDLSFACVRIRHFGDTDSSTVFCPHLDTSSSTLPTHVIVIMSIIVCCLRDQYLVVLFVIINRVSFDFRSEWSPGLSHMFGLSPWEHRYFHIQELSNGKRCVLEILFQFILSRRVTSFVWHNLKLQIRNDLRGTWNIFGIILCSTIWHVVVMCEYDTLFPVSYHLYSRKLTSFIPYDDSAHYNTSLFLHFFFSYKNTSWWKGLQRVTMTRIHEQDSAETTYQIVRNRSTCHLRVSKYDV